MKAYHYPDLHIHSSYSDGSDSPLELLENVRAAGLDYFALTDHDCYDGCAIIADSLKPSDPAFVGGIELSCEDETGKYHILGYCYDLNKPAIVDAVRLTHDTRMEKAHNRFSFLASLGYTFTDEEIEATMREKNPGRPHFAKLLYDHGYVSSTDEGHEIIKQYRGKEFRLTPEMGIDAILKSDGIPVLAHGIKANGSKNLSEEEIDFRVNKLKNAGLMGLECYYSTYTPAQQQIMLRLSEKYNLLVTAGSDYHGTNKPILLGQTGSAPDPRRMERFYQAVELLIGER